MREGNMRKIIVLTFVTLDGIMQAPGGPEEDEEGKFSLGGWSVGYWDKVMDGVMTEQMGHPFDLLLGRKTYDIFAGYWPTSKEPGANELNQAKKYVASRTQKKLTWENSVLLTGDIVPDLKKIKEQAGPELQVHGSSDLIQTLLKNDLVDEFWLKIFPVTIGTGKRLFGRGTFPASFKLIESKNSSSGVLVANYVRDGKIKIGTFAG
jgi:dihydrofolate reductase